MFNKILIFLLIRFGLWKQLFKKSRKQSSSKNLRIKLKHTLSDEVLEPIKYEISKASACPYCNYKFVEMPKRSRKCPACKKHIYRQKNYSKRVIELITEEQLEKEEKENDVEYFISTQEEMMARLLRYQKADCKGVKISTSCDSRVCPSCSKHQGKFYSIKDALKEMPIPNANCLSGQCRCCYIPVTKGINLLD